MIANNQLGDDNKLTEVHSEIGHKVIKLLGVECMENDLTLKDGALILIEVLAHLKNMNAIFDIVEKAVQESESRDDD